MEENRLITAATVIDRLYSVSDEKFRKFSHKLTPGVDYEKMIGVKVPILRQFAKDIVKQDWREFLQSDDDDIFELIMLKGIVIASANMDIDERLKYISSILPKINNWSVCDIFCTSIKPKSSEKEKYLHFISQYYNDSREFFVRFAVVLGMTLHKDEESIKKIMPILLNIKNDGYYVKMAVAWAVSVYFIRAEHIVYPYIKEKSFDETTHNKAIQKICDSLRVSRETKEDLKHYKIYNK